MKIYLVMRESDDDDKHVNYDPIVCYLNKQKAKEHVIKAIRKLNEWDAMSCDESLKIWDGIEEKANNSFPDPPNGWNEYDEYMTNETYEYFVQSVELIDFPND